MYKFIKIEANINYNDYNLIINDNKSERNKSPFERFSGILCLIYRCHLSLKINNRINLPFKQIWNPYLLDKKCKQIAQSEDKVCFIFDGSAYRFVNCEVVPYLRKKYHGCKLVFILDGCVKIFYNEYRVFSIEKLKELFDVVITYNYVDAQKYKLIYQRPKVISYNIDEYLGKSDESDAFFVGAAKDRLDEIHNVFSKLNNAGLKCDFYITDVENKNQLYPNLITYNKRISYQEVLAHVASTKCVVNILEKDNYGITLRDYEAMSFSKLLLTNKDNFQNYDFKPRENFMFTTDLDYCIEKIRNAPRENKWDISEYSEERYYQWLGGELEKLEHNEK